MINQNNFIITLNSLGINFFTGVPDSYLNGFCCCLDQMVDKKNNIIAANEGNAVAIASGYYLSTGNIPLVYLQNSGMGNILNPVVSLSDKNVYNIPMILLIGWRGEPNTNDHPQHKVQGEITTKILDMLEIPYIIPQEDDKKFEEQLREIVKKAKEELKTVAIIAKKGVFAKTEKDAVIDNLYELSRFDAMKTVVENMPSNTIYVASTGRASRELYYLRELRGESHKNDFLNVGSMGHASSVAFGIALQKVNRNVVCFDGDAAAIMHMGSLTMVSKYNLPNFIHVVLNNGVHESVGGQKSAGFDINFSDIAKSCGYSVVDEIIDTKCKLENAINTLKTTGKPSFIDVRIHKGLKEGAPPLNPNYGLLRTDLMEEFKLY